MLAIPNLAQFATTIIQRYRYLPLRITSVASPWGYLVCWGGRVYVHAVRHVNHHTDTCLVYWCDVGAQEEIDLEYCRTILWFPPAAWRLN